MVFSVASLYEVGDKVLIPNKKVRFGKTIAESYYVGRVTNVEFDFWTHKVKYDVQVVVNRNQRILLTVNEADLYYDRALQRENEARRNPCRPKKEA